MAGSETAHMLQQIFNFTDDDLMANRARRLSRRQQKMLIWRAVKTGFYALLAWALLVLAAALIGPVIAWVERFDLFGSSPARIVLVALTLIIVALILRHWMRQTPGILRGNVEAAEGRVTLPDAN